jgi:hypothetical protein
MGHAGFVMLHAGMFLHHFGVFLQRLGGAQHHLVQDSALVSDDEADGLALRLTVMLSGSKRILSFMPTRMVRLAFFGSPCLPKGVSSTLAASNLCTAAPGLSVWA